MTITTGKPRLFVVAGTAVALALAATGCAGDGQSGIPTETPEPPAAVSSDSGGAATDGDSATAPSTEAATPGVTVGDVPGNAAAAAALQGWTNDLLAGTDVVGKCWTIAPERAEEMYADADAISAAVQQTGLDGQFAVTWSANDTDVSVLRSEISSGYACPYVHATDDSGIYTDDDAVYAVERFLGRAVGDPVDPSDTEEDYPLICPGMGIWDPWGTGNPVVPPLWTDPDALDDVTSFDAESATFSPVDDVYGSVTIPIVEAGTARDLVVYVTIASNGYCLGAVG
ncbi:hypothetical protein [Rhodococcus artemisiae]|uniref:Uncharacterized protein n=1 Tax=Rhodococcus artemisiae TaxID=714159 RepID=A0ABU7L9H9_9NOCA|nr:hypothetical protein [Rhodococcus artemisiae]MEE2058202.1 hypothetical protein [Rhodococcus artemisiae]